MKNAIPLFATILFCCFSCRTRSELVTCTNTDLYVYMVGYDWSDAESGMAYKYKQDNAFDTVIDSTRVGAYMLNGDTSTLAVLSPGFDYKIALPLVNKIYFIRGITQSAQAQKEFTYTQGPMHHKPFVCYHEVVSCYVNDTLAPALNADPIYPRDVVCLVK